MLYLTTKWALLMLPHNVFESFGASLARFPLVIARLPLVTSCFDVPNFASNLSTLHEHTRLTCWLLLSDKYLAVSTAISCRTNGEDTPPTAAIQNCWRNCMPEKVNETSVYYKTNPHGQQIYRHNVSCPYLIFKVHKKYLGIHNKL